MPDGDIVHSRLARLYQRSYQWLCEGKADSDECARVAIAALKRDLMRKGDLPIMLAKRMGESLEQAINDAGENGSVDWAGLSVEFDRLAQQADGSHYLYENGIGAINLLYRASAVGLDHSRSVHPLTLLMVSDVVSELLGEEFQVRNPFLFWTKAEMCKVLAEDERSDLPPLTMSCDSPHRQSEQPIQCGYCSSCILRKQALAASKIEDRTRYVVPHGKRPAGDTSLYLRHMLAQVLTFHRLLGASDNPNFQWEALTREFLALDDIVDRSAAAENLLPADMQSRLIKLYRTYVAEWDVVKSRIAAEILDKNSERQASSELSLHKVEGLLS